MGEVQRTEIDGVPVFFVDSPGPVAGSLMFRVGQIDETLIARGLTHLVEHLTLAPLVDEHRVCNGRVALTVTSFDAEGEPEELARFFTGVSRSLASLDLDRLDTERRVLRTEDQRRGASLWALALGLRFGARGYGLPDFPEFGLFGATPESVEAWRQRWFTRANAVLWLSAPPPDGLDLSALPDGEPLMPPSPEPLPFRFPAWHPGADGYVAVSIVAPRTTALWMAGGILNERLYDRLRAREGRSYEVSVGYDPLNADDASLLIVTDTLPDEAESVRDAVSVELNRLARSGPTEEELAKARTLRERAMRDPRAQRAQAENHALESLWGGDPTRPEEIERRVAELDPGAIAAALREAAESALWLVPAATGVYDQRIRALPSRSERAVEGRVHSRPPGVPDDLEGDVLLLGREGATVQEADAPPITVLAADCLALQAFEDGARVLWGADGIRLFVHPAMWRDGEQAVAAIDDLVDPSVIVRTGEPSGYEPPIDTSKQGAGSGGLLRRWRRR